MSGDTHIGPPAQAETAWMPTAIQAQSIAQRFDTPTFAYDAQFAERNYNRLRQAIDPGVDIFYSLKANPNISITRAICRRAAGAEVSSLAEFHTALRAGVKPADIIFVGPAKSRDELEACISHRIFAIVCESIDELHEVNALVRELGGGSCRAPVMLRVNPEFSGAGSGLAMSGKPRQFGIDECRLRSEASAIKQLDQVEILGFHVYMGTRYLDASAIVRNTRNILELGESLADELEIPLKAIDVGGGFGVPYFENEAGLDIDRLGAGINEAMRPFRERRQGARVIIELGRYLVAGCGALLTRIRGIKESMGEVFAICDGGTNVHMAAVGIGSFVKRNFPVVNLTSSSNDFGTYTVTGPLCTPNDTVAKRAQLRSARVGDVLGVLLSGAYGPTASPTHFLSHGFPAEVLVSGNEVHLIRRRETVEDILEPQVLIEP